MHTQVDLVILDFDGVLTDNRVYVFEDGSEAVVCSRADGMGIELLKRSGIEGVILSTETNCVVSARAAKLGVECIQGCEDKAKASKKLMLDRGIDPIRVMYVGNDLNDFEAMKLVGIPVAPADAHPAVKALAVVTTTSLGGQGVIREIVDEFDLEKSR